MISTILGQVGLPALVALVASVLNLLDNDTAKSASQALGKVSELLQNGGISAEQIEEANRHTEKMAQITIDTDKEIAAQINQSLRAEIASEDKYVRRMRPTFGYLMAATWAAQMLGIAYVIIFETDKAGVVMAAMSNLSAIWMVGLSVLGVYVYKRSDDKKMMSSARDVIFWNK